MNNVQFDEYRNVNNLDNPNTGITDIVMRYSFGIIRTKKQANIFLLILTVLILGLSFILMKGEKVIYVEDLPYEGNPNNVYLE